MSEINTNADREMLVVAVRSLDSAKAVHKSTLEKIAASEQRMLELQSEAEELHLRAVEAGSKATHARDSVHAFYQEEEVKRADLQTALEILADAQRMVEEKRRELKEAEGARIDQEKQVTTILIEESVAMIAYRKYLSAAKLEDAKNRQRLAEAEHDLVKSEMEIADAQLKLLSAPDVAEAWPQLQKMLSYAEVEALSA